MGCHLQLHTFTTTGLNREKNIMKTPKKCGKPMPKKKLINK